MKKESNINMKKYIEKAKRVETATLVRVSVALFTLDLTMAMIIRILL